MIYDDIIEDIFYGNLNLNEIPIREDSVCAKAMERYSKTEDWLMEHLEGESKSHLICLLNTHNAILGETTYESFRNGFRVGMRLMLEVCTDDIMSDSEGGN